MFGNVMTAEPVDMAPLHAKIGQLALVDSFYRPFSSRRGCRAQSDDRS
jgi:hypothetical protein